MNTKEFWIAAGYRALRTFIQVILAVWTAGQLITQVDWRFVLLSAFSSAVYSILTSILAGIPEVQMEETRAEQTTFNEDSFLAMTDYEGEEDESKTDTAEEQ